MATPNEITTLLASHFKKELDDPFKVMMMERVKYWRSRLLKNTLDKAPGDRKFFKQTIYVPMETKDEVICAMPFTQCKVSYATIKLPKMARANGIMFDYIGSVDGMNPFEQTVEAMIPALMQGKYTGKILRVAIENDKPKVYGNAKLPKLRIDGIFDNPEDAAKLNCSTGNGGCDYWNEEYAISGDLLQLVVQSILQVDYNRSAEANHEQIPVAQEK